MAGLTNPTWEDERIKVNRGRMGVILLRKERQSRGLSSGSIVKLKGSKLIPKWEKIEYGLITSDKYVPLRGIGEHGEDYFIQYWTSDLKTVKKHSLREVAQSDEFYRPTPGLALIPVRTSPSVLSELLAFTGLTSSVIDERRAFRVSYHSGVEESENKNKRLCIGRSGIEHTIEEFSLITKRNEQGRLQYELVHVADSEYIYRNYDDIVTKWGDLCPRGAAIFENDDEPQPTSEPSCQIGILNFTEDGVISPIFFYTGNIDRLVSVVLFLCLVFGPERCVSCVIF